MTPPSSNPKRNVARRGLPILFGIGLLLLAGCAGASQTFHDSAPAKNEQNTGAVGKVEADLRAEIALLKQQNQSATTQSGIFNFAPTTNSAILSGGSVLLAMLTIVLTILTLGYKLIVRMIPLVNSENVNQSGGDVVNAMQLYNGQLFAAGRFGDATMAKWDGTNWMPLKVAT